MRVPSPASRFAVVIAFVLATASGVAYGAPLFYNNLLRRGIAEFNAGRNAGAVTLLRTAAFGLLDVIDQFETAQAYIAVASQRLGRDEDARHAMRRIMAAERVQRRFAALPLPAELRDEFDAVAKRYLTVAEQAALTDAAAAVPARQPSQTTVWRRSTEQVPPPAPESSTKTTPPPSQVQPPPASVPAVAQPATLPATPPPIVPPSPRQEAPATTTETSAAVPTPVPANESVAKPPPTVPEAQPEEPSKIVEEVRAEPAATPPPTPAPSPAVVPPAATSEPEVVPDEISTPEPVVVPEEIPQPEPKVVPEEISQPEPVVLPEEISQPEPAVVPEAPSAPEVVQPEPPPAREEVAKPVEPAPAIEATPTPSVKLPDEPKNDEPPPTPEQPAVEADPAERPRTTDNPPDSVAVAPPVDAVREAQREFERKVQEVERAAPEPQVRPVPLPDVTKSLQDVSAALERNDIGGAREMLRRILATEGLSRADLLRVAEESYRAGDFANATAAFALTGGLRSGEEQFGYYLAVSLYETGRYGEAKSALRDALPFIELTDDVARNRAKIEGAID